MCNLCVWLYWCKRDIKEIKVIGGLVACWFGEIIKLWMLLCYLVTCFVFDVFQPTPLKVLLATRFFFLARKKFLLPDNRKSPAFHACPSPWKRVLTLTVNSMRKWITSRLIFASKAPSPAKHRRQQSIFKHPLPNISTPSSLKVFLFCYATKNISAKIVSAIYKYNNIILNYLIYARARYIMYKITLTLSQSLK